METHLIVTLIREGKSGHQRVIIADNIRPA